MKVLYISSGAGQDYLRDMVAHGMRSVLGPDFIDFPRIDSLYVGADRSQMYGKGFTLYALLPEIPVDRSDIPRKIRSQYFDLVVYGSIHRCQDYLREVLSQYPPDRVCYLDGEDHPGALTGLPGTYFKRELGTPQPGIRPIQFAIPAEKILDGPPVKAVMMAPLDPIDKSTYIYNEEAAYYAQYASAYYAATMMKAGWDCLRHYEIMANHCIPYFRCLSQCPPTIMENLPRAVLRVVQEVFDAEPLFRPPTLNIIYWDVIDIIVRTLRAKLTTAALACYVLDTVGVATASAVSTV